MVNSNKKIGLYSEDWKERQEWIYYYLYNSNMMNQFIRLRYVKVVSIVPIEFRKDFVLEDSVEQLKKFDVSSFQLAEIRVKCVDDDNFASTTKESTVQNEIADVDNWLRLVVSEMLNPKNGLFIYSTKKKDKVIPANVSNKDEYYIAFGKILGLIFFYSRPLDLYLDKIVFKRLIGIVPFFVDDFKEIDEDFYEELQEMRKNPEKFSLSFGDKKVTKENVDKYINALLNKKYTSYLSKKFKLIKKGMCGIVDEPELNEWTEDELEHRLCGMMGLTVDFFRYEVAYYNCNEEDPIIIWLYEILETYSKEDLKRLYILITEDDDLPDRITVDYYGNRCAIFVSEASTDTLPLIGRKRYLFEIPRYETKEKLQSKLREAFF